VLARTMIHVPEDLDRGQTDGRRDALAVDAEVGEDRVTVGRQVHTASGDDVLEATAGDRELEERLREIAAELGRGPPFVAAEHLLLPAAQPRFALAPRLVHAVVHDAAERVEGVDGAPFAGGQDPEGIVEAGPALPRQTGRE